MRSNLTSSASNSNPTIRVVTTTKTGFVDPNVSETTVWQGTDVDKLSRQFPPSEIWGADPLGHKEIEDGWIRWDTRFERLLEDGTWEKIDDPRRRLTPLTDLEREIDAENRRLFPGDYLTDDDDDGYDSYDDSYEDDYDLEPYDCDDCHDYGCERCEPDAYCTECFRMLDSDETGVCTSCKQALVERCSYCGTELDPQESELCGGCQNYLDEMSKEYCVMCGRELSSQENTICTTCEQDEQRWADYEEDELSDEQPTSWTKRTLRRINNILGHRA